MNTIDMPEVSEENPFIYGMSKQFVNALHELFDVMDSNGMGYVRYADIATQWEEDDSDPLFPKGLINCLSKVTLPNGLLTFDRFCAGIKLCLLKNQVDFSSNDDNNNGITTLSPTPPPPALPLAPPPPLLPSPGSTESVTPTLPALPPPPVPPHQTSPALLAKPIPLSYNSMKSIQTSASNTLPETVHQKKPTASVTPVPPQQPPPHVLHNKNGANSDYNSSDSSSTTNYQRAKSMPQLMIKTNGDSNGGINCGTNGEIRNIKSDAKLVQRDVNVINGQNNAKNRQIRSPIQSVKALSKSCIMKTLQNWKENMLGKQVLELERLSSGSGSGGSNKDNILPANGANNGASDTPRSNKYQQLVPFLPPPQNIQPNGPAMRRAANKRREPRRHTVGSNGIDFNSIRRIQQLEQERSIFFQGLEGIDRARDWYLRQIAIIQDKISYVTKVGTHPADYTLDAYQERINFQAARIMNINQHLSTLYDNERGFPIHMNLAIRPISAQMTINGRYNDPNRQQQFVVNPNVVNRLRDQNRLLTDEVSKKCERITQLEREKSALIRELFQSRTQTINKVKTDTDDTTFM
ncbi:suppressor APC domain-containing protein 2-like [Oppia nitens]|uniref:suppressor APC domain-containing protein 2-like n=1 Tax=Oppia nitens TaxID=1686743 RepID=UPI0023DC743A|nr:suppressor APC domain-containing protein 2-like [Oppia nitens]